MQSRGLVPYAAKPLLLGSFFSEGSSSAPEQQGIGVKPSVPAPPVQMPTNVACSEPQTIDMESAPLVPDRPAFPYNIEFRTANVLSSEAEERRGELYDVILCLKLTKWVHLNWLDDGVKLLFCKCFSLLKPGGSLVLEAQDWPSYKTKKHLTPNTKQNLGKLSFRPAEFETYLVNDVGFSAPETVPDTKQMKRPLLLFRRPLCGSIDPAPAALDQLPAMIVPPTAASTSPPFAASAMTYLSATPAATQGEASQTFADAVDNRALVGDQVNVRRISDSSANRDVDSPDAKRPRTMSENVL